MTLVTWSANGYGSATAVEQIEQISNLGASHLSLLITAYQTDIYTSQIRMDSELTPALPSLVQCLTRAKARGLKITIKPHVNCDNQSWSGMINPTNPEEWFRSYREFILPLADISQELGAELFIIGTELSSTIKYESLWRETINRVRAHFSGKLTYAASWDEAPRVPFWDDLDFVGINFYFPVSNRRNPGRMEILSGWQPWLNHLELLSINTGRKILFTEIGYRSMDGAGMNPHDFLSNSPVDLSEQADLYWAALEATRSQAWLKGMFWWNWMASGGGGPFNSDYTPAGKPAQDVLYNAWQRH